MIIDTHCHLSYNDYDNFDICILDNNAALYKVEETWLDPR